MAKKSVKAKPVKKAAKPAKKAVPVKKVAKPVKKPAKSAPASKKTSKPVAKKTTKPVKKAVAKKATKSAPKAAKKVVAKKVTQKKPVKALPKKSVVPVTKVTTKPVKKSAPQKPEKKQVAIKTAPKKEQVKIQPTAKAEKINTTKEKIEPVVVSAKVEAPAEKTIIKTVEQQMQEKQSVVAENPEKKKTGSKEELFVPKYVLPTPAETVRPMRPKPAAPAEKVELKPVANPIFVPPSPDGKPGIKFAPIAIIERPKEKEKTSNKSEEEDMSSKTSPRLAFHEGDDKKGVSVEAKLRALYSIQLIDSRIDKIHAMRGELPLEVQDLEDDVAGLETRLSKLNDELKNMSDDIAAKKQGIKDAEALIKKYKEQLNNVKNNREYDSLSKEIEFQELEIQLFNKKIKEGEFLHGQKNELLSSADGKLKERKNDLKIKKTELDEIVSSTEKEEKILSKKSDEAKKLIEERLLSAYERIRSGAPNKMAVVPIEREASAGSFIQLPPQKQLDVAARKRVIVDEHSGRILVDAELANEEQEKMNSLLAKELK